MNKSKPSIGAKLLTNKKRDEYTKIQTYKQKNISYKKTEKRTDKKFKVSLQIDSKTIL